MNTSNDAAECSGATPCSTATPLGVVPEFIWVECRFWDLAEACARFDTVKREIPREWPTEMKKHFKVFTERSTGYEDACLWVDRWELKD